MRASGRPHAEAIPALRRPGPVRRRPRGCRTGRLCRLAKRMSQASTNSLLMPRVRPRILAMLTTGVDARRSTKSRHRPSASGRSAALATSRWAIEKSGFAVWNTTTFADGSASMSVISATDSTIVVGTNVDRRVVEGDRPPARLGAVDVELRRARVDGGDWPGPHTSDLPCSSLLLRFSLVFSLSS